METNSQPKIQKVAVIFGTRPEAIKLCPLVRELRKASELFSVSVISTGQHKAMLDQVVDFFQVQPDLSLNVMTQNQTLSEVSSRILNALDPALLKLDPKWVVVQGDTTTAAMGALAAFYQKRRVIHVEAGLRSFDKYAPFPEEVNRKIISSIADFHFCPTEGAASNLAAEGTTRNVFITGNTGIDALLWGLERVRESARASDIAAHFPYLGEKDRVVLVTGHRRENFGVPFEEICRAIAELAHRFPNVHWIYPVHLNPNVREPVYRLLGASDRIHLVDPVDYPTLIWLMSRATLVLTDSGGIQEEAPGLGKPVLVLREVTERPEGVTAGTAVLVGTSRERIVSQVTELLGEGELYRKMAQARNPYGDGTASVQIREILAAAARN